MAAVAKKAPAVAPKAPATFGATQKQRALESNQAMSKALKEHRFEDALEHARTALVLDPKNVMMKEFVRLLEEKAELAESDDDSEGEAAAAAAPGAGGAAAPAATDAESEEEEDEDEGETDEEDSEEEESEESEEDDPAVLKALSGLRMGEPEDPDAPRPPLLSPAKRDTIRASLAARIKDLLQEELAKKMAASDPLLAA